MKLFEKIQNGGVYTIAEMSANHGGKIENALKIVQAAKDSGADCLKIQTYTADTITIDCSNEYFQIHGGLWDGYNLHDLYNDAYTPWDWQPKIKAECDRLGIDFLSTPFDNTAVDFLEKMNIEFYKIASFELVDIPLIKYVASKKKPMIISCGMGSVEEIQDALDACYSMGNKQITLLKCCSEYPANYNDMHIANIADMKERFQVNVGLSDHSMGPMAAIVAVSLGANVIEKHFCLSRKMKTADSEFSMEPAEWKEMVEKIQIAKQIKGEVSYQLSTKEASSLKFRRSIFAVKDIKKGELLTEENIRVIRPANGAAPKLFESFIGKACKKNIDFGNPIQEEDVEK